MSASLVGSEMCIRDRVMRSTPTTKRLGTGMVGHRSQLSVPELRCPSPVSYTHLTLPTICSV
eukprot:10289595-Alexandrium_andersonii.AAC.1